MLTQAGDGKKETGQTGRGAQCTRRGSEEALLPDSLPEQQRQDLAETSTTGRMQRDLPFSAFCKVELGKFARFSLTQGKAAISQHPGTVGITLPMLSALTQFPAASPNWLLHGTMPALWLHGWE